MKPTSPEERDLEKMSSEVSKSYRAGAVDEPSSRLDATILAAARREVQPRPPRRHQWQVPASIAAVLVIGVSLVLIVRDDEPPLPSLDRPVAEEAKLAKPAPPQLAMKVRPKAKADSQREDRPSRERGATRPDREPIARDEALKPQESAVSSAPMSPAAAPPAPAQSASQANSGLAEPGAAVVSKKAGTLGTVDSISRESDRAPGKEEVAAMNLQQDWLTKIDALLREGKQAEARRQLLDFRRQYPDYALAERFRALLPLDQR